MGKEENYVGKRELLSKYTFGTFGKSKNKFSTDIFINVHGFVSRDFGVLFASKM